MKRKKDAFKAAWRVKEDLDIIEDAIRTASMVTPLRAALMTNCINLRLTLGLAIAANEIPR